MTQAVSESTEKLRFLSSGNACTDGRPAHVVETHMSWVFLCSNHVFKMKKSVRYDFLDFSTLAARELDCREEVRLNRRLAPDVYLGVAPLLQLADGHLAIGPVDPVSDPTAANRGGNRCVVDWLVSMRRLPAERMLDAALMAGTASTGDIDRLGERLAAFYRAAPVIASDRASYLARWDAAQLNNRAVLQDPRFGETLAVAALDRFDRTRQCLAGLLAERACGGRIREGHGDLRPEHVALFAVPLVIDCLEFNYALRQVDPFDELAYLDLECRMLGSPWVGPRLIARCAAALGDQPPPALLALYTAGRALLRARLTAAHLLEPDPRTPASWLPKTRRYVEQAQIALQSISAD